MSKRTQALITLICIAWAAVLWLLLREPAHVLVEEYKDPLWDRAMRARNRARGDDGTPGQ